MESASLTYDQRHTGHYGSWGATTLTAGLYDRAEDMFQSGWWMKPIFLISALRQLLPQIYQATQLTGGPPAMLPSV